MAWLSVTPMDSVFFIPNDPEHEDVYIGVVNARSD